jgi:hypothetical protein
MSLPIRLNKSSTRPCPYNFPEFIHLSLLYHTKRGYAAHRQQHHHHHHLSPLEQTQIKKNPMNKQAPRATQAEANNFITESAHMQ